MTELSEHFLQLALDDAELYVNDQAPPLKGEHLESLARNYRTVLARLEALTRIYPLFLDATPARWAAATTRASATMLRS